MSEQRDQLFDLLNEIDGLAIKPSPVAGGFALFYKNSEFAHFHSDNELDLKLGKKLIAQEGLKHPANSVFHPKRSTNSPWIELRFSSEAELKTVARLVELAISKIE